MKKILLAAVAGTGLLASCGGTLGTDSAPPTITSASGVYTNHRLSATATDVNSNITYPAGTYVICDNMNTTVEMSVAWTGYLYNLDVYANGGYYGDTHLLDTYTAKGAYSTSGTISYTFGPNAAPLSVKTGPSAQSINVNPVVAISVKGQTSLIVQGNSYNDNPGNYVTASTLNTVPNTTQLPVVDCQ